jgi:RNA polymerase sigma-70 factor (ECF subfamily)
MLTRRESPGKYRDWAASPTLQREQPLGAPAHRHRASLTPSSLQAPQSEISQSHYQINELGESRQARVSHWFHQWQAPLRQFLSRARAGSAYDCDDVAQEAFLRVLHYDRTELIEHPEAYLFQTASNVSAEWVKRCSNRLPHEPEWLEDLVDSASPELELERQSVNQQLYIALQALPARAREILHLHFVENMTRAQIASTIGVTCKIVKRDTARAYVALRSMLEREFGEVPEQLHISSESRTSHI